MDFDKLVSNIQEEQKRLESQVLPYCNPQEIAQELMDRLEKATPEKESQTTPDGFHIEAGSLLASYELWHIDIPGKFANHKGLIRGPLSKCDDRDSLSKDVLELVKKYITDDIIKLDLDAYNYTSEYGDSTSLMSIYASISRSDVEKLMRMTPAERAAKAAEKKAREEKEAAEKAAKAAEEKARKEKEAAERAVKAKEAFEKLRTTAERGNADAQYEVGYSYFTGEGVVPEDKAKAAEWFRKAAEQGNARAQTNLGILYRNGQGIPKDNVKAAEWFCKAAEQGHEEAKDFLATVEAEIEQEKLRITAKKIHVAAEQGDAKAQTDLGVLYRDGRGVPKDESKAADWFGKAAEQGDAKAQYELGFLYKIGEGVPLDYVKATEWFGKAAAQGSVNAQYELGYSYFTGLGVTRDFAKAVEWFEKAVEQGHEKALNYLIKTKGEEAEEAAKKRAEKLRAVAEQGDANAQYEVGRSYFTGEGIKGITRDYAKAVEWLSKAAKQRHKEAKDLLIKAKAAEVKEKAEAKSIAKWKAKQAARATREAKHEETKNNIGVFLQLVVTIAAFIIFFSGLSNYASESFFSAILELALPVGVPILVIGIISLIFHKNSPHNSWGWGIGLIVLIVVVFSIAMAVSLAWGFWGFIGWLIHSVLKVGIIAIPGFILAVGAT